MRCLIKPLGIIHNGLPGNCLDLIIKVVTTSQHKAKKLTHAQCQANIAAKIEKFKVGGGVEEADEEDD